MAGELITKFDDHALRVSRFIEQWRDKPDLVAWLKTYLDQMQDIEDALFEILLERNLDDAVGVQLTILGDLVQQPRTTSVDEDFRTAIRARILINLSSGTPEDLIQLLRLLLPASEAFEFRDEPPAQLRMTIVDPTAANVDLLVSLLDEADLGGVRTLLQWNKTLTTSADKFTLGDTVTGAVTGGSLGSTTGASTDPGKFSSVIE